ncbi:MAG TPA: AAA family ATPase [Pirellulales bacterium]|nr:AAA family ATPase [Pirellulales bacterium]
MHADSSNADADAEPLLEQFRQELAHCRRLFSEGAEQCIAAHPQRLRQESSRFRQRLLELERGLLVKILVEIAQSDWRWTENEYLLASELFEHCWARRLSRAELKQTLKEVAARSSELSWASLFRPFAEYPALRKRIGDLETVLLRVGNLAAKIDGHVCPQETERLKWIHAELHRCLLPVPLDSEEGSAAAKDDSAEIGLAEEIACDGAAPLAERSADEPPKAAADQAALETALNELQGLIGLDGIKRDVSELTNFLKVQRERGRLGLPQTKVSLHMIFSGNPGTGKTTVARLLGRIFGGLGVLSRGHLIETDRSGLVARYAGQTGPKTHQKIDEALDGVLFIDEAYSLVAERGEDAYGNEALQALLKRMEDDRNRLVVVLAGYPDSLDRLLDANPGLASRFGRRLDFPDYSAPELGRIFQSMCEANKYSLPAAARLRLLAGFQYLLDRSDEKFGNGRLARNAFETAIRRLANRVADIAPLTAELLTTIDADDVLLPGAPDEAYRDLDAAATRISTVCPGCRETVRSLAAHLGWRVQCRRCGHGFRLDWGDLERGR